MRLMVVVSMMLLLLGSGAVLASEDCFPLDEQIKGARASREAFREGEFDKAAAYWERSLKCSLKEAADMAEILGDMAALQLDLDKAIQYFKYALSLNPDLEGKYEKKIREAQSFQKVINSPRKTKR